MPSRGELTSRSPVPVKRRKRAFVSPCAYTPIRKPSGSVMRFSSSLCSGVSAPNSMPLTGAFTTHSSGSRNEHAAMPRATTTSRPRAMRFMARRIP